MPVSIDLTLRRSIQSHDIRETSMQCKYLRNISSLFHSSGNFAAFLLLFEGEMSDVACFRNWHGDKLQRCTFTVTQHSIYMTGLLICSRLVERNAMQVPFETQHLLPVTEASVFDNLSQKG